MGIESIAILLLVTAAAVTALMVGRLIATLLKIAIVIALAYFAYTRIDTSKWEICRAPGSANPVARLLCK